MTIRNFSIRRQQGGQTNVLSQGLTVRAGTDKKPVIGGYGGVYYTGDSSTEYELYMDYYERMMPGAFDRVISETMDVRCLFNHDWSKILARVKPGTLDLRVDKIGLYYSFAVVDGNARHAEILSDVEAGNIDGSSIGFIAQTVSWREEKRDGRWTSIREVADMDVYDVSPVGLPAYSATSATAQRSVGGGSVDDAWIKLLIEERDAFFHVATDRKIQIMKSKLAIS